MTTVHGTPTSRATHATAWAWFPADTVTSPRARFSGGSASTRLSAPRGLNEPVFCRLSALSQSETPARSPPARALTSGGRRGGGAGRAAALRRGVGERPSTGRAAPSRMATIGIGTGRLSWHPARHGSSPGRDPELAELHVKRAARDPKPARGALDVLLLLL